MARRYRTKRDEVWARAEDAKERREREERIIELDRGWQERQLRPAWGAMAIGMRWFWAAWLVRSGEVTDGGVEYLEETAKKKALTRSGAQFNDRVMNACLFQAYEKLKSERLLK